MRMRSARVATMALCLALVALGPVPLVPPPAAAAPVGGDPAIARLAGGNRIETAVVLSRTVFPQTATAVVLARADDPGDALAGTPLAITRRVPILLTHRDAIPAVVTEELRRLQPAEVLLLGGTAALGPGVEQAAMAVAPSRRLAGATRTDTAAAIAEELPPSAVAFVASLSRPADALAAGQAAGRRSAPILLLPETGVPTATAQALVDRGVTEVVVVGGFAAVSSAMSDQLEGPGRTLRRVAGATGLDTAAVLHDEAVATGLDAAEIWLAGAGTATAPAPDALAAGAAAGAAGRPLLVVHPTDLRAGTPGQRLLQRRPDRVVLVGGQVAIAGDPAQLLDELLSTGPRLPDGHRTLFPEARVVAEYGSFITPRLGVLGEGTPDEAGQRLLGRLPAFATPGRRLVPAFELIVTVATSGPGTDGDYSAPSPPEPIQRYLDAARRIGAVVILDIQPGRSDFLTEVRRYEQFLVQPDVGIALDPEWRMGPNQVPAQVIGRVSAEEVNATSAYVADLVAAHDLPEKLFVVHQFRHDMITGRDGIVDRPGLATTIHVDGFGTRSQKLATYGALAVDAPWHNGFKLFIDEDTNIFSPQETVALGPSPDLVTYQ